MKKHVVFQSGAAIYGVGRTRKSAIADARKWGATGEIRDFPSDGSTTIGYLYIAPCTDALYSAVRKHGGDIGYSACADSDGIDVGLDDVVLMPHYGNNR